MFSQVVREVTGQSTGSEESASPVIPRKNELDKVCEEERMIGLPVDPIPKM